MLTEKEMEDFKNSLDYELMEFVKKYMKDNFERNPNIEDYDEYFEQEEEVWQAVIAKYGYSQKIEYAIYYDIEPFLRYYHEGRK